MADRCQNANLLAARLQSCILYNQSGRAPRPLALQRAGAVTTGKYQNRENVIAQLILCIRQVGKRKIGATTQICLLPGSNPLIDTTKAAGRPALWRWRERARSQQENVQIVKMYIAQLLPCSRQVGKGQIGAKTPIYWLPGFNPQ